VIMAGAATRKLGEEILEAAIVEESVQIESCHYQTSYSDLTGLKRLTTEFWESLVMRAGET